MVKMHRAYRCYSVIGVYMAANIYNMLNKSAKKPQISISFHRLSNYVKLNSIYKSMESGLQKETMTLQ